MSIKALEQHLAPLMPFLQKDGVTEICINKPGEVFVEKSGQFNSHLVAELEVNFLESLAALVAEFNDKEFPTPLLAGSLPTKERIQFVMNPACEGVICSIRRHQMRDMELDDYAGVFDTVEENQASATDGALLHLYQKKQYLKFVKLAITLKKNILISGGTGTGKTTFLNACLKHIPEHERLITIEDTREVIVTQPNAVHLLFNEDDKRITALNIFKACLRLRPDRIFLSELRGVEAWGYLRAANSGHPGSLSTIHADSPAGAFKQLVFMMQQARSTSSEQQIAEYVRSIIDIVVQLKRGSRPEKHTAISEIYFKAYSKPVSK